MKKKVEKNYGRLISITIGVIGVLGSLASIYALFLSQKQISVLTEVVSSYNILDVNTDISNLDIIYENKSLKKEKKNLKITLIKITNNGTEDILINYFDTNALVGINLTNGTIAEKPEIIETSNSYLKNNLKIISDSTINGIKILPIILDRNASFTIKFLTLLPYNEEPKFSMFGKIAGMRSDFELSYAAPEINLSFFKQVFIGSFWVQVVKALIYFLSLLIIIILIAILIWFITDKINYYKRKAKVENFKKLEEYNYLRIHEVIFDNYLKEDNEKVKKILESISDERRINRKYSEYKKWVEGGDSFWSDELNFYENLISEGFLTKENDQLVVNHLMKDALQRFYNYVNSSI